MSLHINIISMKPLNDGSNEYYSGNLTHNLVRMAEQCRLDEEVTLYDLLWNCPVICPTIEYVTLLLHCYNLLLEIPDYFKQYNAKNNWGNYNDLVHFLKKYIDALISTINNSDNFVIDVSK